MNINWGDGDTTTGVSGTASHTYAVAGSHTVSVSGGLTGISLNGHADAPKLVSIDQWGEVSWTSMRDAFRGASNMVYRAADTPDLSAVTDMTSMFRGTASFNGNISAWNVSSGHRHAQHVLRRHPPSARDLSTWNVSRSPTWLACSPAPPPSTRTSPPGTSPRSPTCAGMFSGAILLRPEPSPLGTSPAGHPHILDHVQTTPPPSTKISTTGTSPRSPTWPTCSPAMPSSFNGNISTWDVSSVTNMLNMFAGASCLQPRHLHLGRLLGHRHGPTPPSCSLPVHQRRLLQPGSERLGRLGRPLHGLHVPQLAASLQPATSPRLGRLLGHRHVSFMFVQ